MTADAEPFRQAVLRAQLRLREFQLARLRGAKPLSAKGDRSGMNRAGRRAAKRRKG